MKADAALGHVSWKKWSRNGASPQSVRIQILSIIRFANWSIESLLIIGKRRIVPYSIPTPSRGISASNVTLLGRRPRIRK